MIALIVAALAVGDDVDALIRKLGDDDVDVREAATVELMERGKAVEPRLRDALKATDDPEVQARLGVVLDYFANLVEADAALITVSSRGVEVTALREVRPQSLTLLRDGFYTCAVSTRVAYDRRRPQDLLAPILRAEIARPFELDSPAAFDVLTRFGGFAELVPALEARAEKSADPVVKAVCRRAVARQKEVPCSTSP